MDGTILKFKFSKAELTQLGFDAINLWNRDKAELSAYGKNQAWRDALFAKVNTYQATPSHGELRGEVSVVTQTKNNARRACTSRMRTILLKAKNAFGSKGGDYRAFRPKPISNMSDSSLIDYAYYVHNVATELLVKIASKGLTQQELDDLMLSVNNIEAMISKKSVAEHDRFLGTIDRTVLGNEIYSDIMELFSNGRDVWRYSNEAMYNDYVFYSK